MENGNRRIGQIHGATVTVHVIDTGCGDTVAVALVLMMVHQVHHVVLTAPDQLVSDLIQQHGHPVRLAIEPRSRDQSSDGPNNARYGR